MVVELFGAAPAKVPPLLFLVSQVFTLRQAGSQPIEEPLHADDALTGECLEEFHGIRPGIIIAAYSGSHPLNTLEGRSDEVACRVTGHAHGVSLQASRAEVEDRFTADESRSHVNRHRHERRF